MNCQGGIYLGVTFEDPYAARPWGAFVLLFSPAIFALVVRGLGPSGGQRTCHEAPSLPMHWKLQSLLAAT